MSLDVDMSENSTQILMSNVGMGSVYLVTSLAVLVSNTIVMLVVGLSKELHSPTLWNLAAMALCDFASGLYCLVFVVPCAFMNRFVFPESMAPFVASVIVALNGQSLLMVLLASVDRYIAVFRPLRYHHLVTNKRFGLALAITVFINIGRLCAVVIPEQRTIYNPHVAVMHLSFSERSRTFSTVGLPVLTLVIIFILQAMSVKKLSGTRRTSTNLHIMQPLSFQFTVTIVLSTAILFVSYIPFCVMAAWAFNVGLDHIPPLMNQVSLIVLASNSLWNVLVYSTNYRPFRHAFLKQFCNDKYRRQRQAEVYDICELVRREGNLVTESLT